MFGWLFPSSCPCDPSAKVWIERRLRWLSQQFDDHAFNGRRLVLPTPDFFPDPYDGSKTAVRTLLERVCGFMDVDVSDIGLKYMTNSGNLWLVNENGQYLPKAAGLYESDGVSYRYRVTLATEELHDWMSVVGTIAHELAHVRLLGEERISHEIYDNELLTDLTVVFFGLGIFLANVPRTWDSDYTKWPGTNLNKPEYMTRPMFAYALAHLAWFRGETSPAWMKHLHFNARPDFKQALRFLHKHGDSTFKPNRYQKKG